MIRIKGFFRGLSKAVRLFLLIGALVSVPIGTASLFFPTTAHAIINYVVGVDPGVAIHDSIDAHWSTFTAGQEAVDSVAAWANMINEHEDSVASWANKVNAATDSLSDWTSLINAATDSLVSWANEVNASTDSLADWTSLVNEAKDSLTSWANEINAATDSLTNWTSLINEAKDSLTSWANKVNAHEDTIGDWTSLVNEAKDSLTAWANKVNTAVQEYDQFWSGADLAIRTGAVDEIGILFPLANDSNAYFVQHTHLGTTDDEVDTVVFSGYLPMGIDGDGVDSITYNLRTSMIADSVSIEVKVWKRDADDIGALASCDNVAATATTTGAWEHKTTGALDVAQADAGDVLEVWFIITFGSQVVGVLAEHDKPKVWYTGK